MKIGNDIKSVLEDDVRELTVAMLAGEVALADGKKLTDVGLTEGDVHRLAGEVLRCALEKKLLSALTAALGSMKWLTFEEAMVYARMSRTQLKELLDDPKCHIYGTKQRGGKKSKIIVDRESIDAHYNKNRENFIAEIIKEVEEGGYG